MSLENMSNVVMKYDNEIEMFYIKEHNSIFFSRRLVSKKLYEEIRRCFCVTDFRKIKVIGEIDYIFSDNDTFIDDKYNKRRDFVSFLKYCKWWE